MLDSVPEFISQRRRWLNGAFFAAVYSLLHFKQIWYTDHSIWRKALLHLEFVYQFIQLAFTFFSLANFSMANISGRFPMWLPPILQPLGANIPALMGGRFSSGKPT